MSRRKRMLDDLDEDIRDYLERETEDNIARGMSPEEARYAATRKFGNVSRVKEETREVWSLVWLEELLEDIRFGLRLLRKNPGFTAVAILTLALGIGANAAIFSVVHGILLRSLPFNDPDRLVAILDSKPSSQVDWHFVSPNRFEEWVRQNTTFDQLAAAENCFFKLESREPVLLQGGCATASFFPMLGIQPFLGRLFTPEEDRPGGTPVAVLSYGCWKERFGGDTAAIGKTIRRTANDGEFTIIGVLPPDFKFATEDFALWAPLRTDPNYRNRDDHTLLVFARLKEGITLPQAQSQMDGVAQVLAREYPATSAGWDISVRSLQRFYSSVRNIRQTLWVLLAAVGFLLLIACANVANLLLARGTVRRKEIALRLALGAGRPRLVRQLMTESLLLGLSGGVVGLLLARLVFKSMMAMAPYIPSFRPNAIQIDNQVLAYAMAISVVATVVFGLAPALRASRQDLNDALREAGRGATNSGRDTKTRRLLVASEIALAVLLMGGAGLLIESYRNLQTDRLGFNSDHILVSGFCCLDEAHYRTPADTSAYYRQLFQRVRELPGVASVSGTDDLPLRQFQGPGLVFEVQGRPAAEPGSEPTADFFFVEPRYFETMQIPLLRGRWFNDQDDEKSVPVAIVNRALAQHLWPDQDAIGQQLRPAVSGPNGDEVSHQWYRIIGVVADAKQRGLGTEPRPTIYRTYYQSVVRYTFALVRTRPDPRSIAGAVKNTMASVNGAVALGVVQTLDQYLTQSVSTQRFSMTLLALFGSLALSLAAIGVYGVMAFTAAQRTHEVGVRMALGAQPADIVKLVLGEGLRMSLAGVIVGISSALVLGRVMRNLLYGVSATDPLTFLAVSTVLLGVALAACYLPARHAGRVDPIVALRCE